MKRLLTAAALALLTTTAAFATELPDCNSNFTGSPVSFQRALRT